MRVPGSILFLSTTMIAACGSEAATDVQVDALEVYRDGCDAGVCDARPAPQHRCVGGYAVTVCTKARGACGWQIDCADEPPPGYDGNVGVSSCDVSRPGGEGPGRERCGPIPDADERDCVYGFFGEPQCESYDRAPCAWSRSCRPQPCEQRGTCNTLDRSKLGASCDANATCPSGSTCASISVNLGEYVAPTCIEGNPCDALLCHAGRGCYVAESYPAQVGCGR